LKIFSQSKKTARQKIGLSSDVFRKRRKRWFFPEPKFIVAHKCAKYVKKIVPGCDPILRLCFIVP
jgi:hypothetical protein